MMYALDWLLEPLTWRIGTLVICATGVLVFWIHRIYFHFMFRRHMQSIGFPSSRRSRILNPLAMMRGEIQSRRIGATWILSKSHSGLFIACLVMVVLGLVRSILISKPTEFQRLGAILAVVALALTFHGLREGREIKRKWMYIEERSNEEFQEEIRKYIGYPLDRISVRSTINSLAASFIATVIWAYGDQIVGCALFPAVNNIFDSALDLSKCDL